MASVSPYFVFSIDERSFEAAANGMRSRAAWAAARFGDGDLDGALALLRDNPDPDAERWRTVIDAERTDRPPSPSTWLALGRYDLLAANPQTPLTIRAQAAMVRNDPARAMHWLEGARDQRPLSLPETVMLAGAYRQCGFGDRATTLLEANRPPAGDPWRAAYDRALERHRADWEAIQAVKRARQR